MQQQNEAPPSDTKRQIYGLAMVTSTMLLWGALPLLLKVATNVYPANLVAVVRLGLSSLALFLLFAHDPKKLRKSIPAVGLVGILAGFFLAINYYCFIEGVRQAGAGTAGVLVQSGSLFLLLIGVVFLKERLTSRQILGFTIAAGGLALFYWDRLQVKNEVLNLGFGSALLILAGFTWALYMTVLKRSSANKEGHYLNIVVFGSASIFLLPFTEWSQLAASTPSLLILLGVLAFITCFAYSALSEALKVLSATQISIILTLTPIVTLTLMKTLEALGLNYIQPESNTIIGYFGAFAAVAGVAMVVKRNGSKAKAIATSKT